MPQTQRPLTSNDTLEERLVQAILFSSSHPKHAEKWQNFAPSDAAIARVALRVADTMRGTNLDPAEAYLRGIADYRAAQDSIAAAHESSCITKVDSSWPPGHSG